MNEKNIITGGAGIGVLVVIAVIVAFMAFDQVSANKIGVKDRFGNVLGTVPPGLHYTGLFVGVEEYPLSVQKLKLERIESVDKGGQSVFADIAVNFKIKNPQTPERLYVEVGPTGKVEQIVNILAIEEKIQEGFKQVTVQYEALEILEKRDEVRQKTVDRITELFPNEYFEIISITLSNIDYAPSFNDAIQLKKDNTQLAFAEQERVKKAQYEAEQVIETAKGEAESKKLTADAIAYELRVQRLEITPLMIQSQYLQVWDGKLPSTLITSGEGGQDTTLLLPIGNSQEVITP